MSRTEHHRRFRPFHEGNPTRVLGVNLRAAARKGILKAAELDEDGSPQVTDRAVMRAKAQDKPGTRKAFQTAAHRRDRAAVRVILSTTAYRRDPAHRQALRLERALTPAARRSVELDIS
ncbi:hypothetical protein ABT224_33325 [Streptomyces sp. NPDC001584]|uniref:hypothetical protein n=1 Tax=Streptomyces sp. NPDC001584 TaxID=3154521 RepID=UPI003323B3E6